MHDRSVTVTSHSNSDSPIPVASPLPVASPISTALPTSVTLPITMASPVASSSEHVSHSLEFTVPTKWKPSIMRSILEKKLDPDVRNEIVRDLVTHIYGYIDKPTSSMVAKAARLLVEKYPFMADVKTPGSTPHVIHCIPV